MNRVEVPWYVVLWRLPWWLLANFLRMILWVVILFGWGRGAARQMWENSQ